nr:hypothetical protein [Pantoea stewartii]
MPIYKRGTRTGLIYRSQTARELDALLAPKKRKAQQLHDKLKHEAWAVKNLDKRPERLFEDLIMLALRDAEDNANIDNITIYARYWLGVFEGRLVSSLSGVEITDNLPPTAESRISGCPTRQRTGIGRLLCVASRWYYKSGWIDQIPYSKTLRGP